MAGKKKLDFSDIATTRKKANFNQLDFWKRYGVTQSGGSRYESGRNIPKPLAILLWLHQSGKVMDKGNQSAQVQRAFQGRASVPDLEAFVGFRQSSLSRP
jgi:transcriptional regulator with XRE-family HTH domain